MILALFLHLSGASTLFSQVATSVTGRLTDQRDQTPLPYTNVILTDCVHGTMIAGTSSDTGGWFTINQVQAGTYRLKVSLIGYETLSKEIHVVGNQSFDAGTLSLSENITALQEVMVTGIRSKGKAEQEKTVFYMTRKIYDVSRNGLDAIRHAPGVQVDLQQNISLEGSRNILILVDGRETDQGFVSQINPELIDRVEVMSAPPSKYDANVTGVINIVLKKDKDRGIAGNINLEIPTSAALIYSRPSVNLSIGLGKTRITAFYKGEMIYGNIHDVTKRTWVVGTMHSSTVADQQLRQEYRSHRFEMEMECQITKSDRMNLRAYYNPTSRSLNGSVIAISDGQSNQSWESAKINRDLQSTTSLSLYYQHHFNEKGAGISLDLTGNHLRGESSTSFTNLESAQSGSAADCISKPGQHSICLKLDGVVPITRAWRVDMGAKWKRVNLWDATLPDFDHTEQTLAFYGSLGFVHPKFDFNAGLRLEDSRSETEGLFSSHVLAMLPSVSMNLHLGSGLQIRFSAGRSLQRPGIWQLNPSAMLDDPFTISTGNPLLRPEYRTFAWVEYAKKLPVDFFSVRLFFENHTDVLNTLMVQGDSTVFGIGWNNLGRISQAGAQALGTFNLGKSVSISPFLKVCYRSTTGNDLARLYQVENRGQWVIEPGLTGIVSLPHDMAASVIVQYVSPKNNIQDNSLSGPLYFITFDKTFKKGWKAGMVCGVPLTRHFNYNGSAINGRGFTSNYRGDMQVPGLLLNLTLSYRFGAGKFLGKSDRKSEEPESIYQKKGF